MRSVAAAHGYQGHQSGNDGAPAAPATAASAAVGSKRGPAGANPNWISSLASIKMSNVVASGSNDGFVRLWTANAEERQLSALAAVPVQGFANAIALTSRLLVVGGGKEHKHGRWWNLKGNHNKLTVVRFDSLLNQSDQSDHSDEGSGEDSSDGEGSGDFSESGDESE